jgi:hypothetical protein
MEGLAVVAQMIWGLIVVGSASAQVAMAVRALRGETGLSRAAWSCGVATFCVLVAIGLVTR